MTQGRAPGTPELLNASRDFCDDVLPENSIHRFLFREGYSLFPDDAFADLYSSKGRQSISPHILAVCTVLQRLEGLSDREAVERFMFDARWKYAAGGLSPDFPGFVHSVLVGFRARLRDSERPNRIFEAVLDVAKQTGLLGHRRALDSTPLYDAVATQDTVTMIRAAIRGVLRVCDPEQESGARAMLKRDDRYDTPGKPACEWDDDAARTLLVDALARDGWAMLTFFDDTLLALELQEALTLLATVLGQDLEQNEEGLFRIARRVAKDRVISTVDPEARHGHKTNSRSFDGYKGHIAVDPDSEIITATVVSAGNAGDASVVEELLSDVLNAETPEPSDASNPDGENASPRSAASSDERATLDDAPKTSTSARVVDRLMHMLLVIRALTGLGNQQEGTGEPAGSSMGIGTIAPPYGESTANGPPFEVYGDAAYGTAQVLERLDEAKIEVYTKVQQPSSRKGCFAQSEFVIDLEAASVSCPANITVALNPRANGTSVAQFKEHCASCPLREKCTTSKNGRQVNVHAKHATLHRHREQQQDEAWKESYRQTRPKAERKFGHLMRRRHGGRRARVRGTKRVDQDFSLLAAAVNLARLTKLGVARVHDSWSLPPAYSMHG